ncbi:amino acid adenylation domain-containing protein [Pedobacter sp. MC2016-14]|uniref:non-ribosomal peptide synthetase n=1 Tax=Pedobacter sp. MC2016-14 TaxID=2897327 RepID=UPI001E570BE2|nr:amino acid adenylation domain-containing protein [Pedobacter sp. MC2016-14]MCD0489814.1 amino acid adenylation domain-containing protein [Pedobacter sp. MC2016-14]
MLEIPVQLIDLQVQLFPQKTALIYKEVRFSYVEMNERANQFAAYLIERGVEKDMVIGIVMDRSPEMVITLLAVLKSGAAYVPLDPEYPKQRLEYMLQDSKAKLLIIDRRNSGQLETDAVEIIGDDVWPRLHRYSASSPGVDVHKNDLAYLLYTSGSTGKPKGVMIEHGNLFNLLLSMQRFPGITQKDTLLSLTTISFDISVLELFLPLTVGATLIITDAETTRDAEALHKIIKNRQVSFIQATPSTYKMMLAAGWKDKYNLKILCCGEQLPKDLAEKLVPKCTGLYNMYGPTETTIYSTGKLIKAEEDVITIGKPIDNTEVYILDDQLNRVEDGETGEICIAGDGLARGYFDRPELTAEKFPKISIAGGGGQRLYRTGDLGKILPNGEIQCFGRIDHMVKVRGYRIELGEIEYALIQQEGVYEVVVVPWVSVTGDQRLAAYVVLAAKDAEFDYSALVQGWRLALRHLLPHYMVPNDFMVLDKLPLTENGKTDRKALPAPVIRAYTVATPELGVRTEMENVLAEIWKQNLGIEEVGINDNFFELGGHSLTAVKVMVSIKKETGKSLPLATLFRNPTIAALALMLEAESIPTGEDSLIPLKISGNKTPLYIVHGLGSTVFKFLDFAHQLDPEQPVYGFQARGIDGEVSPTETVEEMASQFINEILVQNPDGPYALSGYSFGTLIAFEMAQQLTAMGKKVCVLISFDGYVNKAPQLKSAVSRWLFNVYSRIAKFIFTSVFLLSKEPRRTIEHKLFTLKRSFQKLKGEQVLNDGGLDEDFDYIAKVAEVHRASILKYRLKPYKGDIHLFKAKKLGLYLDDFKYLGWKPYVKKVHIYTIEDEHLAIFDTPINTKFTADVQEILNKSVC